MEGVTNAVNGLSINNPRKKYRIQVSNTKKPLFFYVNLAKRHMQVHNEIELSALGMGKLFAAIATTVSVAEILKNSGFATVKQILTSTVDIKDDYRVRPLQKAKISILLGKTEEFDELMAAAAAEASGGAQGDEQN
ncbi:Uncharacterized protein MA16_Dca004493 [Dendrobium catenatum]|uniref:DNA/RNA-binding protein Alba-like domain-containing protein n=1 Tax=Dendrobium catenatum TaxID=906689 RepID=A0A2I0W7M9_9ASPA|nr:Uncharacterized protein MA16_Dca004493 [Dendrobium catenatum]